MWLNNVRIEALWTINQSANVWAWINGSWRKFSDRRDDATTNFAILAAHAKEGNHAVNVREENGQIREMYVW